MEGLKDKLVGFNPSEKYSNWNSSPNRGENKKYLKPPPSKTTDEIRGPECSDDKKSSSPPDHSASAFEDVSLES